MPSSPVDTSLARGEAARAALLAWLRTELASALSISEAAVHGSRRFQELGLSSFSATQLIARIGERLDRKLSPTVIWAHPTLDQLVSHLTSVRAPQDADAPDAATRGASDAAHDEGIAIVGIGCRFPGGASSPSQFWRMLVAATDAIVDVPAERWSLDEVYDADGSVPGKSSTRFGGFLDSVDGFDAGFFGISPREVLEMDPQQRLMLELAWEALQDAAVAPLSLRGTATGVFVGSMWQDYARLAAGHREQIAQHTATGQDLSIIPARISYFLGLEGPSILLNTACSSSLVAVHTACRSLRLGESSLALAGGVSLTLTPEGTIAMSKFGAMAPDGRCKAFAEAANGYVRGEGGGIVVLKRYRDAVRDGDRIYGLVRGSAVNNDGYSNGLTAPSPSAQVKVVQAACRDAGIAPSAVQYVETHGPGTRLGDPIEASALGEALGTRRPAGEPLRLGSVKTNIGHLEAAAGIAGLIKVALCLHERALVPNLHFAQPSSLIPFDELNLRVQTLHEPWTGDQRVAGVSSFGFGGTNCHVLLSAAPGAAELMLALSAKDAEEYQTKVLGAMDQLSTATSHERARVICRALSEPSRNVGSRPSGSTTHAPLRVALLGASSEQLTTDLVSKLRAQSRAVPSAPRVIFVCSGQGSQWPGMCRELLRTQPVFRDAIVACDEALRAQLDLSVLDYLVDAGEGWDPDRVDIVQPVLFAVQVALGQLWRSWDIKPAGVIGHSMGEVAAAYLAGALSLADAARVIRHRSRLAATTAGRGTMAVVGLSAAEADALLPGRPDLAVAAYNGPKTTVLSGPRAALESALRELEARGVYVGRVDVDFASHSPAMDPLLAPLRESLAGLAARPSELPIYSTVHGARVKGEQLDIEYWVQNLRRPVRLVEAVQAAQQDGPLVLLELSPHPVLTSAMSATLEGRQAQVLGSLRRQENELVALQRAACTLHEAGVELAATGLFGADDPTPCAQLLTLSAHDVEGLARSAERLASWLDEHDELTLRDIAYTSRRRAAGLEYRFSLVGSTREGVSAALRGFAQGRSFASARSARCEVDQPAKLTFVFPGQGSQWVGMGRQLLREEPAFARALARCDREIMERAGWSLLDFLLHDHAPEAFEQLDRIQPALFAFQVALVELWRSWGVRADAVIGHSMGEVAAAWAAGALSLRDAVQVICARSRLVCDAAGDGGMLLADLTLSEAQARIAALSDVLSVAANNGPRATVLSGDRAALTRVAEQLQADGVFCRWVKVAFGSHSPQMDPLRVRLREELRGLCAGKTGTPLYSSLRRRVVDGSELAAEYWADNLRMPVMFADAVRQAADDGQRIFVEVSPHPVLLPSLEETLSEHGVLPVALCSTRRTQPERAALLETLGALFVHGAGVDLTRHQRGTPVELPRYPFARKRYWPTPVRGREGALAGHPLLGEQIRSSLHAETYLWQRPLSCELLPYLEDHRVEQQVVVPAATFLELALSAAGKLRDEPALALCDVTLPSALALGGDACVTLQTVISAEDSSGLAFRISSRVDAEPYSMHVQGRVQPSAPQPSELVRAVVGAPSTRLASADFYRSLAELGLDYGPLFRSVGEVAIAGQAASAPVQLPESLTHGEHTLHPALLDACLQLAFAPLLAEGKLAGCHVPVGCRRIWVKRGSVPRRLRVHARSASPQRGAFLADLSVLDETGAEWVAIEGLCMQQLANGADENAAVDAWLIAPAWHAQPRALSPKSRGPWLVVGRAENVDALTTACRELGTTALALVPGDSTAVLSSSRYQWSRDAPHELKALVARVLREHPGCAGALHVMDGDCTDDADVQSIMHAQERGSGTLVAMAQALVETGARDLPRLWVVTHGAQAAEPRQAVRVEQAALWGLGRCLAYEHPGLRCARVDLEPAPVASSWNRLLVECLCDGPEEELALRGEARYVGRLQRTRLAELAVAARARRVREPYALTIAQPGKLRDLSYVPLARNPLAAGEVEIEVHAAGLNFLDVLQTLGVIPGQRAEALGGLSLGGECAGVVSAIGPGVAGLQLGQRVVALAPGAFATHATARAELVVPLPASLSMEEGASLPLVHLTAYYALEKVARLARGERVLIHAAAGGVGLAAIQYAKRCGAEILATAGSPAKVALLQALGVQHVFDSRSTRFERDILTLTGGEGVDVVLNSLAGSSIEKSFGLLRDHGRFIELGKRDYIANAQLGLRPFLRNLSFSLVDLLGMIQKRPAQVGALLREVMSLLAEGEISPVPLRAVSLAAAHSAFQDMAAGQHTGKLALTVDDSRVWLRAPGQRAQVRSDRTYLITGGTGGLGMSVAEHLVRTGARHLVLTARREAGAPQRARLEQLRAAGATVSVHAVDVADELSMRALLDGIQREQPPLGGVVHAAGVLDDALLAHQDAARLRSAMMPKIAGAWLLHRLTEGAALDFFVLYSSAASLLGLAGQLNYGAANAFMDALAHHRRQRGLPGLSINWGPFAEVGLAAVADTRGDRLSGRGMRSLSLDDGLRALSALLSRDVAQLGVLRLDVRQWAEFYPHAAATPRLASIRASGAGPLASSSLRQRLSVLPAGERLDAVECFVREQAAQVLRLAAAEIAGDEPLKTLGLDSLMGLELRNRLESGLAVKLSATLLWTYPDVARLSVFLAGLLLPQQEAVAAASEPAPNAAPPRVELSSEGISALSEEAATALMNAELRELEELLA